MSIEWAIKEIDMFKVLTLKKIQKKTRKRATILQGFHLCPFVKRKLLKPFWGTNVWYLILFQPSFRTIFARFFFYKTRSISLVWVGSNGQDLCTLSVNNNIKAPGNTVGGLQELCVKNGFPMPTYSVGVVAGQPHQRNFAISKSFFFVYRWYLTSPLSMEIEYKTTI